MKKFMDKITDTLADAALLERGVEVKTTAADKTHEPVLTMLKRFFENFSIAMADAALLEIGNSAVAPGVKARAMRESMEENLIEVAFAEAADYDDIHIAILREHQLNQDIANLDECRYGDNDIYFRHAA